jgi:hypothetical protein
VVCRPAIRVEPLGREQLSPRPLVLLARLEQRDQPPIDVVDAHDLRIGRSGSMCYPRSPSAASPDGPYPRAVGLPAILPRVPSYYRDPDQARRPIVERHLPRPEHVVVA